MALQIFTIGMMILVAILAIIPFIPGPMLVWAIGIAYAALTGFEHATVVAAAIMTVLMIIGTTTEFWLPLFGVQSQGMSCLAAIAGIIGGVLGSFLIPIPILGTIIGSLLGVMVVEYSRLRELRQTLRAGKVALQLYVVGVFLEMAFSFGIIVVFVISVVTSAS